MGDGHFFTLSNVSWNDPLQNQHVWQKSTPCDKPNWFQWHCAVCSVHQWKAKNRHKPENHGCAIILFCHCPSPIYKIRVKGNLCNQQNGRDEQWQRFCQHSIQLFHNLPLVLRKGKSSLLLQHCDSVGVAVGWKGSYSQST